MKKVFIVILVAIVVLLPTITAAVLFSMPDQTPINITGNFYDGKSVNFEFNRNKNAFLASFFEDLDENSSVSTYKIETIKYDKIFYADITRKGKDEHLTLYISANNRCYFTDNDGVLYQIEFPYSNSLISSEFTLSLYEELNTPTLSTFSNDVVIPQSSNLKYIVRNGSSLDGRNAITTNETITYYSSKPPVFNFSVRPDICNIKAYVNNVIRYDGALYDYDPSLLPSYTTVRYEIDATWVKSDVNDCFGDAHYSFYVTYAPAPSFTFEDASLEAGEFLMVKATNIRDTSRISCTFSGGLKTTPKFFHNGNDYYAIIPFDLDTPSGTYNLTLTCGETTKTVNVQVSERNRTPSSTVYDLASPLTEQMLADMNSLISSIGLKCSDEKFTQDNFINYETEYSDEFFFKLGYGRVREFNEGTAFDMIGIEFSSALDVNIPVINSGIVCASGEDTVLGKYIVVDHGYGLKSWYCNIGETSLSVGDRVLKGDTIAKTGNSAFYNQPGFYLITTVLDIPVSPYAVYENNFVLPN